MSKFLKFIVNIFLVAFIVILAAIAIPPLAGVTQTMIDDPSIETNLPYGSIVYSTKVDVQDLQIGDEIIADQRVSISSPVIAYKILDIDAANRDYRVVSATNPSDNEAVIKLNGAVQKVAVVVPYLAYIIIAVRSVEGIIIIALIIILMIILFILSELWKHEEYEDDDEEAEAAGEGYAPLVRTQSEPVPAAEVPETVFAQVPRAEAVQSPAELSEETPEQVRIPEETPEAHDEEIQPSMPEFILPGEEGAPPAGDGREEETSLDLEDALAKAVSDSLTEAEAVSDLGTTVPPLEAEGEIGTEAALREAVNRAGRERILEADQFIPTERPSMDDILDQVRDAGANPSVSRDDTTGVTMFDYSDLI